MAERAPPLVSSDWLAARTGEAALVVIDLKVAADGGRAEYEAGHVPGAVFSAYAGDGWRQKIGNVPGLLPEEGHLAALFGRLGITPEHHVVLVPVGSSANDLGASARAYWTLRACGHRDISILDGGLKGWIAAGHPVETGWQAPVPAPAYPVRLDETLRVKAEAVLHALQSGSHVLVDARAPSFFDGREKASEAQRAGHIPGAVSVDYALAFDADRGGLRPLADLEQLFAVLPSKPVVSYCNTGHSAAFNWFVLSEILGRTDVALYDGSMTDWTQDEKRPVATTG